MAGGVALDRRVLDSSRAARERAERGRKPVIERFATELGLTTDQRSRIETILNHYRTKMHSIWEDVRPRYSAIVDSARSEIEAVLTPQQVQQYRKLLERETRHRENRRGSPSGETGTRPDSGGGGDSTG